MFTNFSLVIQGGFFYLLLAMVQYKDIEKAYGTLSSIVHKTPLLTSRMFNEHSGNEVFLKAENLQRAGAFKIRGAYNKIYSLSPEERCRGVVAHSSGNHAQGVALAGQLLGVRVTVVMPKGSVPNKVEGAKSYGAKVVFSEDSSDAREQLAKQLKREHGYVPVPPFDDDDIIAGQGTVTVEISRQQSDLDYLFVPVGGGGLISGNAIAAKHLFPKIKVVGVETEPANDCYQTFRQKKIVRIAPPKTIADGMRTQAIGERNFEIIMKYVDDVITVTDDQVIAMMKFFAERMKVVVEPTGAVAPAAVFHNVARLSGKKAAAIISGGNVDPKFLKQIL
ncbi:MAG: threonine/serine dehydratase [Ignavibacteriae bacterium]|nr:threonine/serine dehydratase [Ignavibacteriota bacterium]